MKAEKIYDAFKACGKVSIDTRKDIEGSIFFGLLGENGNGGQYAAQALQNGAQYAVVDDARYVLDDRVFYVDDTLKALQNLAHRYRKSFLCPVIGITGSNGKTTTKELINQLLKTSYRTHVTQGNFNNHIGLPLTILSTPVNTEILILEMGASAIGEIDALCKIGEPTHGLISNIGPAHIEGFGSLEGVKEGKSELYRYLDSNNGTVFVNADEDYLSELSEQNRNRVLYTFRPDIEAQFHYTLLQSFPDIKIAYESSDYVECTVALYGKYNAMNAMTAISVARYFKVADNAIQEALSTFKTHRNRSQIIHTEYNHYVMDAYNANPLSMKNSIEAFANMESDSPKVLMLGDMKELGENSVEYHQSILDFIEKYTWEAVYIIGPEFNQCIVPETVMAFPSTDTFIDYLKDLSIRNKFILLKGSRSMAMERVKDIVG